MSANRTRGGYSSQIKIDLGADALSTLELIAAKLGQRPATLARKLLEDILRDVDFVAEMVASDGPTIPIGDGS